VTESALLAIILTTAILLWAGSMRAREAAHSAARAACNRNDLQFLDETVALADWGLQRDSRGQMRIRRIYSFEFSIGGTERRGGAVRMLGLRVLGVSLDLPEHTLHEEVGTVRRIH
jgi:hypothetical protein